MQDWEITHTEKETATPIHTSVIRGTFMYKIM